MILFWLICAGLLAIALAFILPTLLQAASNADKDVHEEANVEVYRDQLSELEADLANGIVSPEGYEEDRDAIERRLLVDVAETPQQIAKPFAGAELKSWGMILLIVGACSFSVLLVGTRFRAITVLKQGQPTIGIVLLTLGGLFLVMRSNRSTAYGVALAIPILAGAIYLKVGDVRAVDRIQVPIAADGEMSQQRIEANLAAMAQRLEQNPGDADGWAMLARSYLNLEKFAEASNAYAKAVALKPNDADLLTEYAFALAMANGRQLQGQPAELVKKALQLDPENPRALQLAGTIEFDAKNYDEAIRHWQKLLAKSSGSPELAQAISKRIEEAKALAKSTAK